MSVPSWQFLAFALAGALVFNLPFGRAWRTGVWLVMNLIFVWSFAHGIVPLLPLAGFLALGYAGLHTARIGRGWAPWLPVIVVLAAFIWLKRYAFIPPALLLPTGFMTIGLSYIFFRVMHLVIDAGQGAKDRIGIIGYINFTLNFPALVSGPIQRYEDYLENASLPLTVADAGWAIWRIVLGGFKVLIVSGVLRSMQLDLLAGFAPDLPIGQRVVSAALIVILYALFLYANFSGYTDFVIGIARFYRLRLAENFDHPFSATNFINFWSRWHISLSQWLRSYVFNPILITWMRRKKSARGKQYPSIVAFFVTFFLVGAWHGPTSEFLFFGVLQGGGVAGNRLFQVAMTHWLTPIGYERLGDNPVYRAFARGLTFVWFAFTLLWFWSTWRQIGTLAEQLGWLGSSLALVGSVVAASAVLAIPDLLETVGQRAGRVFWSRYTRTALASAMILALVVFGVVLNVSAPEIVYKQF